MDVNPFCNKITDYWDPNKNQIGLFGDYIRTLSPEEQNSFNSSITEAIRTHVSVLSDKTLLNVGAVMVDDLYRSMSVTKLIDQSISLYLKSSALEFLILFRQRGFVLQYIMDKIITEGSPDFQNLLGFNYLWFTSAGFVYVCPQKIALDIMLRDNIDKDDYYKELPRYIEEARYLMHTIIDECISELRHFILIDADFEEEFLFSLLNAKKKPGFLRVLRNQPVDKSKEIAIIFPDQPINNNAQ